MSAALVNHFAAGRSQEAEKDYQQALALFAQLKPEDIDTLTAFPDLAGLVESTLDQRVQATMSGEAGQWPRCHLLAKTFAYP